MFHKDILNEEIRLAYLFKDIITLYQGRKKWYYQLKRHDTAILQCILKIVFKMHRSRPWLHIFLSLILFYQKIYGADGTNVLRKFRDNN